MFKVMFYSVFIIFIGLLRKLTRDLLLIPTKFYLDHNTIN